VSASEKELLAVVTAADSPAEGAGEGGRPAGSPPLEPFGLVLHHDARWTHEGQPIRNRKLRERFDQSVVYLPDESKYVVQIGLFRGEIEVEEAGFFVRSVDLEKGTVRLSDGHDEPLDATSLSSSSIDSALICRVKRGLAPEGLPARFMHAAQAELLAAVEEEGAGYVLPISDERVALPEL
jgi:hypothetical protein